MNRVRTVFVGGSLVLGALVMAPGSSWAAKPGPGPTPVDWNRFHFSLDNAALNGQETTITTKNAGRLKTLWTFNAGAVIYGSPAVSGSRVIFGTANGTLWILNKDTGTVLKSLALGQNAYGSGAYMTPSVEGDFIYYQDAFGNLVKYNMSTDAEAWRVTAPANDAGFSSPAVYNGKVFAGLSNGTGDAPCTVGKMQAFDKNTGALLWSWDAAPAPYVGGGIWNSPAIDTARNLVIFATGNPPNGSAACGDPIPPNTPGDYTDSIVALNADTGALVWYYQAIQSDSQDLDFGGSGAVLFNDGTRDLVGAGSKNGKFYTLDRATGGVAWIDDLTGQCVLGCGGMVGSAGAAYGKVFLNIGTNRNSANIALDMKTGAVSWKNGGSSAQYGGPAEANGMVFSGNSNSLLIMNATTGAVLGSYATGGQIDCSPAVSTGRVYFGSSDGRLYVLTP